MKIGVVFKKENKKAADLAGEAAEYLKKSDHMVVGEENLDGSSYILCFGGDGTLIHKACEHAHFGAPIVGINTGNLGFLTAVEADEWKTAVDSILDDKIFVSERLMVSVTVDGKEFRGVNEAVIKGLYRVIDLEVLINGEDFLRVLGDGVIIATQTGSTAYSLSSGGPIVDPELNSFLITPINPIGLPIPSAVMSSDDKIEVNIVNGEDVSLIIDGQEHTKISNNQRILVFKGKDKVRIGYLSKQHFFKALNAKFGLSARAIG